MNRQFDDSEAQCLSSSGDLSTPGQSLTVTCPVCGREVLSKNINQHLDSNCAVTSVSLNRAGIAPIFTKSASGKSPPEHQDVRIPLKRSSSSKVPNTKRGKLLSSAVRNSTPLAERLRPSTLDEFVGQRHLTDKDSLLRGLLTRSDSAQSAIFWGPPGCGKTTLARLFAKSSDVALRELNAMDAGISDLRTVFDEAKGLLSLTGRRTIIFLDEIHRFNKTQQDVFLPYIEQGYIQLIGATTENPSFKLTSALLSRCRVFVFERLQDSEIEQILLNAVSRASQNRFASQANISEGSSSSQSQQSQVTEDHLTDNFPQLTRQALLSIVSLSTGDARTALSLLEIVLSSPLDVEESRLIDTLRRSVSTSFDRSGDSRYDMISALHKSVRGSNGSAAMYWLARMLSGGEDPLYIARRMVVCASEDIGLADNTALPLAIAALQACQQVGMPECRINLAHLVAYLAEAPKSTRAYEAYARAEVAAKADPSLPVPLQVRNAPTDLMKAMGNSDGYHYNPDYVHPVTNTYLPLPVEGKEFLKRDGDISDKIWDEEGLKRWENEVNGGLPWPGRM